MGGQIEKDFNVETEYRSHGLPLPGPYDLENQFERECFMSINLIRSNPQRFVPHIAAVAGKLIGFN